MVLDSLFITGIVLGTIILVLIFALFWRNSVRRHRNAKAFFACIIFIFPALIFAILEASAATGTPLYWIMHFGSELSLILVVLFVAIFISQLTAPSANNLWITFFLICMIPDLAIHWCLILI